MLNFIGSVLCRFLTIVILWLVIAPKHLPDAHDGVAVLIAAIFWTLGDAFQRKD